MRSGGGQTQAAANGEGEMSGGHEAESGSGGQSMARPRRQGEIEEEMKEGEELGYESFLRPMKRRMNNA